MLGSSGPHEKHPMQPPNNRNAVPTTSAVNLVIVCMIDTLSPDLNEWYSIIFQLKTESAHVSQMKLNKTKYRRKCQIRLLTAQMLSWICVMSWTQQSYLCHLPQYRYITLLWMKMQYTPSQYTHVAHLFFCSYYGVFTIWCSPSFVAILLFQLSIFFYSSLLSYVCKYRIWDGMEWLCVVQLKLNFWFLYKQRNFTEKSSKRRKWQLFRILFIPRSVIMYSIEFFYI